MGNFFVELPSLQIKKDLFLKWYLENRHLKSIYKTPDGQDQQHYELKLSNDSISTNLSTFTDLEFKYSFIEIPPKSKIGIHKDFGRECVITVPLNCETQILFLKTVGKQKSACS